MEAESQEFNNQQSQRRLNKETEERVVEKEMKILMVYIPMFVILDVTLALADLHLKFLSDTMFLGLLVLSIADDLIRGPVSIPIAYMEARMFQLWKIIFVLFTLIFICACLTNQFWVPVELDVIEEQVTSFEKQDIGVALNRTVWELGYRGFRPVKLNMIRYNLPLRTDDEMAWNSPGTGNVLADLDLKSTWINAGVHSIVGATKFTIARLMIVEAEMLVKMLIKFYKAL